MKRLSAVIAVFAVASSTNLWAGEEAQQSDDGNSVALVSAAEGLQPGQFWLGMRVTLPDESLRKKHDLPEGQGVVVQQIVPDSPAAKVGLKPNDILLKIGDKPIKELKDALEAVHQGDLSLEVIRDGKTERITVKPAKRPSDFGLFGPEPGRSTAQLGGAPGAMPELRAIRAELQEIQRRLAAINQHLAQLESSRSNPNRERMMQQMTALKRAASELKEAGRTEDADRLIRELQELAEKFQALGRQSDDGAVRGSMMVPGPGMPGAPPAGPASPSLAVMRSPEQVFQTQLQPEPEIFQAEPRRVQALRFDLSGAPPDPMVAGVAELRKQVEQMHRELNELREFVAKTKRE